MEGINLYAFLVHLLAQSGLDPGRLGQHLGDAFRRLKRPAREESAQDPLTQLARSLAREDGADVGSPAALRFYKAYALESMGRVQEALVAYDQCQREPTDATVARYSALAGFRQGLLFSRQLRWGQAERCLKHCIRLAQAVPLPSLELSATSMLVRICRTMGRHAEALGRLERALAIARLLGDEAAQAQAYDVAGDLYRAAANYHRALQSYEQSLDLFRKLGNAEGALVTQLDIGALYQASGSWEKAGAWYRACLREAEESGRTVDQAAVLYELACLHIHKGEARKAAQMLLRDMSLYRQIRDARGADRAGRMLLGLGVWMQRRLTENQLTFRDIERGSAQEDDQDEEPDEE